LEKLSASQLAEVRWRLEEVERLNHKDRVSSSFSNYIEAFSEEPPPQKAHNLLISKLQQVVDGEIKSLIVNMPPGSAKSTYTSINFPPFWIQRNPGTLLIGASHAGDLAERFGRKVRNIVGDAQYHDLFDVSLKDDSRAAGRWETDTESEYYAVGTGGSITGRRGDIGLIDDPVKGRKEADSEVMMEQLYDWYISDFLTRLKPGAPKIIIQTRWSENDLTGRILPEDYDGRSGPVIARDGEVWEVLNLPMEARENDALGRKVGELLWPEWFNPEWVAQMKRTQGSRNWNCLYQNDPTPEEGTLFKRKDFHVYDNKPKHRRVYMFGDYAVTKDDGDFSEIGVWGATPKDDLYLLDQFRGQVDILVLVDTILDFVEKYKPIALVGESGVIRRAIEPILNKQMRKRGVFVRLEWLPTTGDKVAMCAGFQALVQQGVIHMPNTPEGESLIKQLLKFPAGIWDDGVDMCGLLGRYIDQIWKARKPDPKDKPIKLGGPVVLAAPGFKMSDMMDDELMEEFDD
jgi:predicted phage terminase large subunit-like protein